MPAAWSHLRSPFWHAENDAHRARRLAILRRLDPILPNGGQHSYAANRISLARSRYRNGCVPERTFRITPAPVHRMTRTLQTPAQRPDPAYRCIKYHPTIAVKE